MKLAHGLARTAVVALMVAAGTLVLPQLAGAQVQVRMGGPGGGFGPGGGISRSSLDQYAKLLDLSPVQKESAQALHEAYMQDQAAASREMQEQMKSVREGAQDGDLSVFRDQMPTIMKKHAEKSGALEKTFIDDLKSLLTPAQASNWPKVERFRRRDQWLRGGFGPGSVSGSSVDLVNLVDGLKLSDADRAKLVSGLDEYEQSMDRVLQERERAAEEDRGKQDEGIRNFDMDSMQAMMKKQAEQAMKVREVNQRYARILASQLPDDQKAAMEEQFKQKSFRQVYGDSSATRRLTAAEKLGDLTPQQQERLNQIRNAYKQAARPLNDRWAAAQEQAENEGKFSSFPMMMFSDHGSEGNDELSSARQARRDLDKKTADQLNEVLSPDQRDRMPKNAGPGQFARFGGLELDGGDMAPGVVMVSHEITDDGNGEVHSVVVTSGDDVLVKPAGDSSNAKPATKSVEKSGPAAPKK